MREWLSELKYRLRLLFKRRQLDKDLQDELAFHIAMREEALQRDCEPSPHTTARVRFGNVTTLQEDCREVWVFGAIERVLRHVRYAVRALLREPTFTLVAVISLALGIGSTTGIFSLYNQILLRALPVVDSSRLVNLGAPGPEPGNHSCGVAGNCDVVFSYPMFRDLERAQTVFTGIAAHVPFGANVAYHGQTMSGDGSLVSGSYFPVLGMTASLGRLLGPEDDIAEGKSPVAVLSHAYWQTHLGGSPTVLNDTIVVNGQALTIVGVTPAGFDGTTFGPQPNVYIPINLSRLLINSSLEDRRSYWIYLFARLRPGVSIDRARQGINIPYHAILNHVEAPLQTELTPATLSRFEARQLTVDPGARGQSVVRSRVQAPLTFLLAVTGFVLLIACTNIANLLLARAEAQTGEMAIRVSIGAGRRHLMAQLLTEPSLLALLGGAAGLLVGRWTLDLLEFMDSAGGSGPGNMPSGFEPNVLIFAAILTCGTVILFGLFPALHHTRADVLSSLKGLAGQPAGARSSARIRSGLATFQIAISLILLFAAGLFSRSLLNISKVDLGVKIDKLVTFSVSPAQNGYTPARSKEFFVRLEADLRQQPGISAVTASQMPVLAGGGMGWDVVVEGFVAAPDADIESHYNEIGPGYFSTFGVPLIAGREFTESDSDGAAKVVVVNEQFVKKFNLGPNPIGKHMGLDDDHLNLNLEIVGLVKDSKYSTVKDEVPAMFYRPYRQESSVRFPVRAMAFYVRAVSDPDKALAIVQPTVARIDPNLAVENLRTMYQQVSANTADARILGTLSAAFAILATLLAAVGIYGVMAYTVAQRSREFGLRLALGASPLQVRALVLRQVGWVTAIGGALGLLGAVGVGRVAQSLLFELKGNDPLILLTAAMVLSVVALGAGFIPAYRASKVDPIRALRYE